jgi:hypothetical protein
MIEQNLAGSEEGPYARENAPFDQLIARPRPRTKRDKEGGGGGGASIINVDENQKPATRTFHVLGGKHTPSYGLRN